jgi:phospholipid-binding lipoprotein MlaA
MQFRLQDAEENFARFHLNTMFGLFGVFDIASDANIERHREDFGQTLGRWGVPSGPYIVLPLLGPSTLRDTVALPVDWRYDIISSFRPIDFRNTTYAVRAVDTRSNLLRVSSVLDEASLDTYSFVRDAYLQRRRAQIRPDSGDDEPDVAALPAGGRQRPRPERKVRPGRTTGGRAGALKSVAGCCELPPRLEEPASQPAFQRGTGPARHKG